MHTTAAMEFPEEVLASTQLSAERLAERATRETALALYRERIKWARVELNLGLHGIEWVILGHFRDWGACK